VTDDDDHFDKLPRAVRSRIRRDHDDAGHWYWVGGLMHPQAGRAYGQVVLPKPESQRRRMPRFMLIHRYVWEVLVAPIPPGHVIDHVCHESLCCNPDHLEPVTIEENSSRGGAARQAARAAKVNGNGHNGNRSRPDLPTVTEWEQLEFDT